MDIRAAIRQFITGSFFVPAGTLSDDEPLVETGVIDSTGVLEVIQFLEQTYRITLADDEIVPENLGTIGRIAALVERKRLAEGRRLAQPCAV